MLFGSFFLECLIVIMQRHIRNTDQKIRINVLFIETKLSERAKKLLPNESHNLTKVASVPNKEYQKKSKSLCFFQVCQLPIESNIRIVRINKSIKLSLIICNFYHQSYLFSAPRTLHPESEQYLHLPVSVRE